ncbi:MAG: tyrosine-type recombinase/integrase [Huintestinicola sp.]
MPKVRLSKEGLTMSQELLQLIQTQAQLIETQQQLIAKLLGGDTVLDNALAPLQVATPVMESKPSASLTNIDIEGFCEWMRYHEQLSENTIDTYSRGLKAYCEMFPELSEKNVLEYKAAIEQTLCTKSVNIRLNIINKYLDFIGDKSMRFRTTKVPKTFSTENIISLEQYNKLTAYCDENNQHGLSIRIKILGKTGCRISEARKMKKSDLVKGYCEVKTKGNKVRRILFPDNFIKELTDFYATIDSDYLFYQTINKNKPMSASWFTSRIKDAAERAGIPREVVHPHSFRHMFAINFLKNNGDLSLLADLLGHENISTTAIYTRMSAEQQHNAVNNAVDW